MDHVGTNPCANSLLWVIPETYFSTTDDAVVKSLTVDIQGQEVDNCLDSNGETAGKDCFANIRNLLEEAGN